MPGRSGAPGQTGTRHHSLSGADAVRVLVPPPFGPTMFLRGPPRPNVLPCRLVSSTRRTAHQFVPVVPAPHLLDPEPHRRWRRHSHFRTFMAGAVFILGGGFISGRVAVGR